MNRVTLTQIASFIALVSAAHAQITIPAFNTPVTENFNSIGNSATASLPANWRFSAAGASAPTWNASGNFTATSVASSTGSPATGGRYNWGNTAGSDRSVGFMTSGGYASPNSIMAFYSNGTGSVIDSLTLSFDINRYRINTTAATISLFTSTNGSTWTAQSSGNVSIAAGASSLYNFGLTGSTFTSVFTQSVTLTSLNLANNGSLYVRWSFTTGSANSQGLGLDNVSLTAIPEPSTYATILGVVSLVSVMLYRRHALVGK